MRRPITKIRTIQKFIKAEAEGATLEVKDVLGCIAAIIEDRYTIRKVTKDELIDLRTQEPVDRYTPTIQSSIQTAHGRVPTFGTGR